MRKYKHSKSAKNFQYIIEDYNKNYKQEASKELKYFKNMTSLEFVIQEAGMARMPSGKRYSHQNLIPAPTLQKATDELISNQSNFESAISFDELHNLIRKTVEWIKGIGELYVYDTAVRIGAYLGLKPEKIYLHRGTRVGLKKLGIDHKKGYCEISEIPKEFQIMEAYELEDILCIYKESL